MICKQKGMMTFDNRDKFKNRIAKIISYAFQCKVDVRTSYNGGDIISVYHPLETHYLEIDKDMYSIFLKITDGVILKLEYMSSFQEEYQILY